MKHQDLSLAQLQAPVLISPSQPCFQGGVLLSSWLHFRACVCQLLCAQAPLTHPAWMLLPAFSNHICVAFLTLSLYLECPESTFHRFQTSLWSPGVPLCSLACIIHFLSPSCFGHSCLIRMLQTLPYRLRREAQAPSLLRQTALIVNDLFMELL